MNCVECGAETKVRTGVIPRLRAPTYRAKFLRIPGLDREICGVRAGDHGTLIVDCGDEDEGAVVWWIRHKCRTPIKISGPHPVPLPDVRSWAAAITDRAEKLLHPDAEWRDRKISPAMARNLEREGLEPARYRSMGDASDALARKIVRERVLSCGLANEIGKAP